MTEHPVVTLLTSVNLSRELSPLQPSNFKQLTRSFTAAHHSPGLISPATFAFLFLAALPQVCVYISPYTGSIILIYWYTFHSSIQDFGAYISIHIYTHWSTDLCCLTDPACFSCKRELLASKITGRSPDLCQPLLAGAPFVR